MTEQELRLHRCGFTGHRPEKLRLTKAEIQSALQREIEAAIADGFVTFLSGMARGVDLWAAEIVLNLRQRGAAIHLVCASPYEGVEKRWAREWQDLYAHVMRQADFTQFISPHFDRQCFQQRNKWIVDHVSRMIAVYSGQPGGTENTIRYARRTGVPVICINS